MADCKCIKSSGLDMGTPRNLNLTAFYKRSFAHHTVKERLPIIVTQIIDGLVRSKEDIAATYEPEAIDALKNIIGELSKLKYEIQTNKPLKDIQSDTADAKLYNKFLKKQNEKNGSCHYFDSDWLLVECYMYRRIKDIFEVTNILKDYDPFRKQKQESYESALPLIISLGTNLISILSEGNDGNLLVDFVQLLKLNLWGNKCDLSLSNGMANNQDGASVAAISELNQNILVDQSSAIWNALQEHTRGEVVDIVLDNAGYELFTDFCLADFLITNKLSEKIRFYVKTMPWFISDVMVFDFNWMLKELSNSDNEALQQLGEKWSSYVSSQIWTIEEHNFWTLPVDFSTMIKVDEALYRKLQRPKLIIFKGDLNYRKLFGDKNWDPVTSVVDALNGFHPSKLCTLRTLKADIICGLPPGLAEKTEAEDKNWLTVGKYGVIQFSSKVTKIPL